MRLPSVTRCHPIPGLFQSYLLKHPHPLQDKAPPTDGSQGAQLVWGTTINIQSTMKRFEKFFERFVDGVTGRALLSFDAGACIAG